MGFFKILSKTMEAIYRVTQILIGANRTYEGFQRISNSESSTLQKVQGAAEIVLGSGTIAAGSGSLLESAHVIENGPVLEAVQQIGNVGLIYEGGMQAKEILEKYHQGKCTVPPKGQLFYLLLAIDSLQAFSLIAMGSSGLLTTINWGKCILKYLPSALSQEMLTSINEEQCTTIACEILKDVRSFFGSAAITVTDAKKIVEEISKEDFKEKLTGSIKNLRSQLLRMIGRQETIPPEEPDPELGEAEPAPVSEPSRLGSLMQFLHEKDTDISRGLAAILDKEPPGRKHVVTNIQIHAFLIKTLENEILPQIIKNSELPEKKFVCAVCQKRFVQNPDNTSALIQDGSFLESRCFADKDSLPDGSSLTRAKIRRLTEDEKKEVTAFKSCLQRLQIDLGRRYKEVISTHQGAA